MSVLPELNLRNNLVADDPHSVATNLNRDACLPKLDKEFQAKTSSGQFRDGHKQGDTNREVEYVKSAWRTLRESRNWTKEKARSGNAYTSKWSKIIERMTRDMDRTQKRYLGPGANRYLAKSANNVLKATASKLSLEEDVEIARRTILPEKQARFKSASCNRTWSIDQSTTPMRLDEAADISTEERTNENLFSSQLATKQNANIARSAILDESVQYLQNYAGEARKLPDIEKSRAEECLWDMKSSMKSANDIADMLAALDIGSFDFYDDFEKHEEEGTKEVDEQRCRSNTANRIAQIASVDSIQQNGTASVNTLPENNSRLVDAESTILEKSNAPNYEDNAFIKIGLNVLNKSVPRDKLSQIVLQSEYLRKDLSL